MAKKNTVFFCKECGHESYKWLGQCPGCKEWNTFTEGLKENPKENKSSRTTLITEKNNALKLEEITVDTTYRIDTGLEELNRVLGGGLVPGSIVLLGGDPGIGKSTILLQICDKLSEEGEVLYISGEENPSQIKMRAERIGTTSKQLSILSESNLDDIEKIVMEINPKIIIVDSVQMIYRPQVDSVAGSVSQIREVTASLTHMAKSTGAAIFLIGHVTKDGGVAGPKTLEHMVDTVLYFEGDRYESYRVLRTVKNRFGSTNEIGVFEMCGDGFAEVTNPSGLFISEDGKNSIGCGVTCVLEGTRPILTELQALASVSSYNNPMRRSTGLDLNRITLLIAILEKRAELNFAKHDIYFNVVGGLKITERSSDLAAALIITSSLINKPLLPNLAILGELSLTGEIRSISNIEKRLSECEKMGFSKVIVPKLNIKNLKNDFQLELIPVENINQAIEKAFESK